MPDRQSDPVATNPDLYRVLFENDRVRVLEYRDTPGARTTPHGHPDSLMVTLSAFRRRLIDGERSVDVELTPGVARWLDAQHHAGENIGDTASHAIFVELKEPRLAGQSSDAGGPAPLGPQEA